MSFYIHEDDWGRISIEPEENRFDRGRVIDEVRAFGEAHRAPSGVGWTDIMIVPPSPVSIAERAITIDALRALLGPTTRERTPVTTGYSSHVETVEDGFAFACSAEPHWDQLYGCARDGVVTQLNLTFGTPAIAPMLCDLGARWRLILVDISRDCVIDLGSREVIDRYLADDEA